jgi:acyl-CoA synthetase (AMP-forming)/AMP-acid ligase II
VVSATRRKVKLETVGPPFEGVEVKIAEDGEILVRGELVMTGYWNDPRRPPRRSATAGCTPATSASSTTTAT